MNSNRASRRILLVRHGSVAARYKGVCYGRSDVELSDEGRRESRLVAEELAALPMTRLFHSGLSRARLLAELISALTAVPPIAAPALAEIDFGQWELRTWQDIFAETGDAMAGMIHSPATFRPPSGETVFELRDRVLAWHRELPSDGLIVAVAHGGSIAALRGALAGLPASRWPELIPPHGRWVELDETANQPARRPLLVDRAPGDQMDLASQPRAGESNL
ncbi:MAG TPA: histidine phosphatase family protein [Pirellulales bacterium]|nr:histidine phosphatase family protein [Pirellulales bacterium]